MNKATMTDPFADAPAEVQAEIRAKFAAMDRMDERIAKDFEEIDRLNSKFKVTMAEIQEQLRILRTK